jgi:hypothetical protein
MPVVRTGSVTDRSTGKRVVDWSESLSDLSMGARVENTWSLMSVAEGEGLTVARIETAGKQGKIAAPRVLEAWSTRLGNGTPMKSIHNESRWPHVTILREERTVGCNE